MDIAVTRMNGEELRSLVSGHEAWWGEQFPLSLAVEDMRRYMTFLVATSTIDGNRMPCGVIFYEHREAITHGKPDTLFTYMFETAAGARRQGVAKHLVNTMVGLQQEIEDTTGLPVRHDGTGPTDDGKAYLNPLFARTLVAATR